jgi:hypothetical protein
MKINLPKIIRVALVMNLVLLGFILLEFYLGFSYLYQNLDPQPQNVASNNIIRVNRETFRQVSTFLTGLDTYTPPDLNLSNSDPFNLKSQ